MSLFVNKSLPLQLVEPDPDMDELFNVLAILGSKPLVGASADEMVKNHFQEISASAEEMGAKLSFLEATALSIYYGMIYYNFGVCSSDYPEEVSNEIILHDSYSNQLPEYL